MAEESEISTKNDSENNEDKCLEVHHSQITFSGPLPPPTIMEQYEMIVPGAAERILKMAEDQSRHRQTIEKRVIYSDTRNSLLGLIFALVLGVVVIVCSIYLVVNGKQIAGTIVSGAYLVSLVSVFIYGSNVRKKERSEQREETKK